MLLDGLLGLEAEGLRPVSRLGHPELPLVILGVALGILSHPLDFRLVEAARLLDLHGLLLVGAEILRAHVQDAVGIDVELHLDLRGAAGRSRDALQVELAQQPVVAGHWPLPLKHAHRHGRLIVGGRAEHLLPLGRHGGVPLDELGEDAPLRFDAERERRDVEQEHVLHLAPEHAPLDCGSERHDLVGVDALVGFLAEQLADELLHLRHAGGSADQHHLVDLLGVELGVFERLHDRAAAPLDQRITHLLELCPSDGDLQVLGPRGIGRDEGQIDVGTLGRRELLLGLFAGLLEPLQGHRVFAEIDALLLLELIGHVIDQGLVEVVAAEVGVAVGADHPEHAVGHLEHRDVERAAAEVEHHDRFLRLLVEAVGERRRRGLVDDPHHLQARDLTGILGGLPLGVVEIRRDSDHRLVDLVAEIGLSRLLERPEHLGGDLRRGELLVTGADLDVVLGATHDLVGHHLLLAADLVVSPAHEPLDGVDGSLGIGDGLPAGDVAHERLALVVEGDHARREAVSLLVRDHLGLLALHHGDDGVGGAEVDADDLLALLGGHDRGPLCGVRYRAGVPSGDARAIFDRPFSSGWEMQRPCHD